MDNQLQYTLQITVQDMFPGVRWRSPVLRFPIQDPMASCPLPPVRTAAYRHQPRGTGTARAVERYQPRQTGQTARPGSSTKEKQLVGGTGL